MKYSELISELEYWKRMSSEDDPEVVMNTIPVSLEIGSIQPVRGIKSIKAIGILIKDDNEKLSNY